MRYPCLSVVVAVLGFPWLTGCYHMNGPYGGYPGNYYGSSPSMYRTPAYGSPNGYGGYPTYQSAPIQTLTPGQEYYPGTFPPGTISPSTTPPTYQYQDGTSTLQPLNNSSAPALTPDGKNVPVPDPFYGSQPSTYSPPAQPEFSEANLQPAGHSAEALPSLDGVREVRGNSVGYPETADLDPIPSAAPRQLPESVPADPMSNNYFPAHQPAPVEQPEPAPQSAPFFQPEPENPSQSETAPTTSDPLFEAPIPAKNLPEFNEFNDFNLPAEPPATMPETETPAPQQAPAMPAQADPFFGTQSTQRVSPFAYDAKYRWLKGVVSRENDGSWSIVYSDNPHPNDQLAGQITLANSPMLSRLQDGDIVQVDGQIATNSRDRLGKATYLVSGLKKVAPR